MQTNLEGRVALVTGGADGIGKVTALKLAQNGADIVLADKNVAGMEAVAAEIKAMGRRVSAQEVNLWNYDSVKEMADRAVAEMGKINTLFLNGAATPKYAKFFRDLDPRTDYEDCLRTQQWARLYVIHAMLDHLIEQNYGKIVIVTSDAGRTATPRETMIGDAAAGLVVMTKGMANEFSRWQIRVNCLCLTIIDDTPAYKGVMATEAKHIFQKALDRARLGIPNADDVAEAALFFCAPESDRITGQILSVNGGLSFPG